MLTEFISRMQMKGNAKMEALLSRLKSCACLTSTDRLDGGHIVEKQGLLNPVSDKRSLNNPIRWVYCHGFGSWEDTVELKQDINQLVAELSTRSLSSSSSRVVGIYGMAGLGKTTLARKVYNNDQIRRHFECFAWVYVSENCQPRDVWESILIDLTSNCTSTYDDEERVADIRALPYAELARKVYQIQQKKRCLIVIDDIWSTEDWDRLCHAFPSPSPDGKNVKRCGSRILLTTRNREVATHADPKAFIHEPRLLTEEEGWQLFLKTVFDGENPGSNIKANTKEEQLGRELVRSCVGLPLAIHVLGTMLLHNMRRRPECKSQFSEWEIANKDVLSYIMKTRCYHNPPVLDACYCDLAFLFNGYQMTSSMRRNKQIEDDDALHVKLRQDDDI